MIKVAVDAMGGDHAPFEVIKGSLLAIDEYKINIVLVGVEPTIKPILDELTCGKENPKISIVHAPEVVGMSESPSAAFKKKKESSIAIGLKLLKEGEVDAFVSAGNTGAVMAASTLTLGRIPGIERPALSVILPSDNHQVLLMDIGSNVDCKPEQLVQFAIMGDCYARLVMGVDSPRIGLLSIGEEEEKGNHLVQSTFPLLKEENLNFIGNVESREIFVDRADVVVCDGFMGNSLIKFAEGLVTFFLSYFKKSCKKSPLAMLGALFLLPTLKRFKKETDYEEFGGTPLLGINGVSVISHGKSESKAIKNAIRNAVEAVQSNMIESISGAIQLTHKTQ